MKTTFIKTKLIACFMAVLVLASVSGVVALGLLIKTNTQYNYALVHYGFSQGEIGKAMLALSNTHMCERDIVSFTNEADITSAKSHLETSRKDYATYSKLVQANSTSEKEKEIYAKIESSVASYVTKRDELIALGDTMDIIRSRQAQERSVTELDPIYNKIYAGYSELMELNVSQGHALADDLLNLKNIAIGTIISALITSTIVAICLSIIVSKRIGEPIKNCADRLALMSQGDLTSPVPEIRANDETKLLVDSLRITKDKIYAAISDVSYHLGEIADGNLAGEINKTYDGDLKPLETSMKLILSSLNETMSQIDQSADQVSSGSDQVASGAQALSQGATQQASSVEELAATMADISKQVNNNASSAANASTKVSNVGEAIAESNKQMQDMISAMSDITSSSHEISKIIKTIEDIAFQTNILALNAAVEAARAGAAGKGFAVVADEVRNLASKSAEASKSTSALIEGSIRAVEHGTRIANETANSLMSVVDGAKEATAIVDEISSASNQQANSVAQVTLGVDQISSVVQTNSATAEESAAASEELTGQSQILKSLVGRFRLKNSHGSKENFLPSDLDILDIKNK